MMSTLHVHAAFKVSTEKWAVGIHGAMGMEQTARYGCATQPM